MSLSGRLVSFVENRFRVHPLRRAALPAKNPAIPPHSRIAVVGGGLAGPAFARQALGLAAEMNLPLRIDLLTHPHCNYCAGLITDLALKTMTDLYDFSFPGQIIKEEIHRVVYLTPSGEVIIPLPSPLTSVLRTNKFQQKGFDESWLDSVSERVPPGIGFFSHANVRVTEITRPPGSPKFRIAFERGRALDFLEADYVVLANGLKGIQQPLMQRFIAEFGYEPPRLIDASVTEIDTSYASYTDYSGQILVADGIVPNCLVALIPKGKDWLTVTGLGKVLAEHDLEMVFNHPLIRRHVWLENVTDHLRCRKICSASVAGTPAGRFCGDGWIMIGDLTGCGRALKDGYFAALHSAWLAARALLCHGASEKVLREKYQVPLRRLFIDNQVGMALYYLDQWAVNSPVGRLMVDAARRELQEDPYGGMVVAALRALFTGELSYRMLFALFIGGLAQGLLTRRPRD